MAMWWPISTVPTAAEEIEIRYSGGETAVGPWPMAELNPLELQAMKKAGDWPDFKRWTPTHWRPCGEPEDL